MRQKHSNNLLLTAALNYPGRGWSVVPLQSLRDGTCTCEKKDCAHPGKHPIVSWKQYQTRRPTETDIQRWWTKWPTANVGIVTGAVSGLIVIDVDPRHEGDKTLQVLTDKYGELPATVRSITGGGGRHVFLAHPGGGVKIASKATALGTGIDIRADGGYVVAPPSLHASGKTYEWEPRRSPDDVDVAPAPSWLVSELGVTPASRKRFVLPAVINEGQRNDTLYRYARHLKSRGADAKTIQAKLAAVNRQRCKPPLPESEIAQIVQNALTGPDRVGFHGADKGQKDDDTVSAGHAKRGKLPTIIVTGAEFRDITGAALDALRAANDPPTLFQRGGLLTRVRINEGGTPSLESLSLAALRGVLARVADWRQLTRNGPIAIPPPTDVVQDILALSAWPNIPSLQRLVEAPTFASDGTLLTNGGYHAAAEVWFHRAGGFTVPSVEARPSGSDVSRAREFLIEELLHDFPFDSKATCAHVLAAMLLPFVRQMIAGPTPLHLIDAPAPGTGKGLLADVISIPAMGRGPEVMAEGQDDEEWRKRITAVLIKGPTFIMVDNVGRRLDSAALAAALTAPVWSDRILGKTAIATIPNNAVWLATGNNITVSNEVARRSVWMRIDAMRDMPWKRTGFRHAKLRLWMQENRGRIVHACLTLVQAWIAAGRRPGQAMLGSFEAWAETMSGILDVAEVPGFLANADQFYAQADEENQEWRAFVLKWWDAHHDERVRIDDLFDIADELNSEEGQLNEVLGDGGDRSKRTRLGKALGRLRDRIFDRYRIVDDGEDNHGRKRYRLRPMKQAEGGKAADVTPTSRRRSPQTSAAKSAAVTLD